MEYRRNKEVDDAISVIESLRDTINELETKLEEAQEYSNQADETIEGIKQLHTDSIRSIVEKDTRIEELESEVATLLEQVKTQ